MTQHPEPWLPGTPCWVDLTAGDLARTQAFYSAVLGWSYTDSDPESFGGYCNALIGGDPVAGLSPTMPGLDDVPHVWSVYLASDDLSATGATAEAAGAQPMFPPMELGPLGSMGMWIDPTSAAFGVWQSGLHTGFNVTGVHGSVAWNDLMTGDYEAARAFYATTFGYTYSDIGMEGMRYCMFTVPGGEYPAGGLGEITPAGAGPSAWSVCFQHDDVDAVGEVVIAHGGTVTTEPYDFEFGRLIGLTGPDGEQFQLITPAAG
jgi:predicted enzyme related to lactoylglutathione lyase